MMKEKIPKRNEDFTLIKTEEGEIVLANIKEKYFIKTDELVIAIWLECDGEKDIDEITKSLIKNYKIDLPFDEVKESVKSIIDILIREGILYY